jgi:predicted nucleic-acid-binding protein
MNSVDTNVLARYVMQDDPVQSVLATEFLATQPCFVPDTVLLETAWLLSSRYGVDRQDLVAVLRGIVELPNVAVSDKRVIDWAIDRFSAGADFADMLHIVLARYTDVFVSFERHLATMAGTETPTSVRYLR